MVSNLSIVFMSITAIISIGLPLVLFLVWRRKYGLKIVPMLVGMAAFIVFALVLEQLLHAVVLRAGADGKIALMAYSPLLFVLYGAFAAGVFEETARFISFQLLKKKYGGVGTGLSYGIGHGGIEAILLVGLTMISNIVFSALINSGNTAVLGSDPSIAASIDTLIQTDSTMFLLGGFERVLAVAVQISLSMLVWCAVKVKGKAWLYPVAILLHAAIDTPAAMYQAGIIKNLYVVYTPMLVPILVSAFAAWKVCGILERNSEGELSSDA